MDNTQWDVLKEKCNILGKPQLEEIIFFLTSLYNHYWYVSISITF